VWSSFSLRNWRAKPARQDLFAVSMSVSSLKHSHGEIQDDETQQALSKLYDDLKVLVEGIRRLSHELHPAMLRLLGLAAALEGHCSEVATRHGVEVSFETAGDLGGLQFDTAVSLFRIAQESLRNAIVHGGARRLAVSLTRSGDEVQLTVTDDGRGFDLEAVRRSASGLGLVSIEERAHAVSGELQIVTGALEGTTIRVQCPARDPSEAAAADKDVALGGDRRTGSTHTIDIDRVE
jgi:signal transduction histidine kinase